MALLLNRKYGSRLECLYYIIQMLYKEYGTEKAFMLNDIKFDKKKDNVHNYCQLLEGEKSIGKKYCPYLNNELDTSYCYATQSVESDTTKSKAVSDIGGSLEALGFIKRNGKEYMLMQTGKDWAMSSYSSKEWAEIAQKGVLSYGPVIGLVSMLRSEKNDNFCYSNIYLGYPETDENVNYIHDGKSYNIPISTGSQQDSNTRTKSHIIGWCVAVGLVEPDPDKVKIDSDDLNKLPHIKYKKFLNEKRLNVRKFVKTDLCKRLLDKKIYVANPLSYARLHKEVRSLRENNGEVLRNATMANISKILARRFVFVYVLNYFSKKNKEVFFPALMECMEDYSDYFFTPKNEHYSVMRSEIKIANLAGIPFDEHDNYMYPLTIINDDVLCEDAPFEIKNLADTIATKLEEKND